MRTHILLITIVVVATGCAESSQMTNVVTSVTTDDVTVYGDSFFGSLDKTTPLVLLFHQGGANGRGEYTEIAAWLNSNGYRSIAWDQRSGGDMFGYSNRTVDSLSSTIPTEFCDAYPDLQAALDYVARNDLADEVILWGSSYSAALVFRLAAANPDKVAGIIAFSPASGGPMANCRARLWIDNVEAPVMVLRPSSEMARESSVEQRQVLAGAGANFHVVENGVHGSSMLVDSRTDGDTGAARRIVLEWLGNLMDDSRTAN